MTKTRIQLRGICPVCGGEFATRYDRMVEHGYTIQHGFQSGSCHGVRKFHLGHKDCPEWMKGYQAFLTNQHNETSERIANGSIDAKEARQLKRYLSSVAYMQERMSERLSKWQEKPLREVDLEIEEAEQRKERERLAEQRKNEREAIEAQKEGERIAREEKAAQNAAKKLAEIRATGFVRIWFDGEVIREWTQENGFETEREFYNTCNELRNEHFKSLETGEHLDSFNVSRYLYEMRSKPNGKGKRIIHLTLCSSPAAYFNRYN